MAADDWTDAQIEKLKTLWAAGYSSTEIANELRGGFSRSAVIGKVHRLKLPTPEGKKVRSTRANAAPRIAAPLRPGKITALSRFGETACEAPARRNQANSIAERVKIAEAEPGIPEKYKGEMPDGTGVKLIGLSDLNCHWPKGDPLQDDFEFCGARAVPGMPYCAHHCRISYTPAVDRRRAMQRV